MVSRLDPDEEAALSVATLEDIMALADILNTNPQEYTWNKTFFICFCAPSEPYLKILEFNDIFAGFAKFW
jgi:hypothetical protein